jgi:hypothetical protein
MNVDARHGISFLRHGAARAPARRRRLGRFADFGLHHQLDVGGKLRQCSRHQAEKASDFGDAIAVAVPCDVGLTEPKRVHQCRLGVETAGGMPFFEALVADNLDLGRPDEVQLIFGRKIYTNTDGQFSTKVVTRGVDVIVNVFYKHSRIKEYLKEGRALRIETVCNSPTDLGCKRRLHNLPELQAKARAANRRLLTIQRAGQGCAVSTTLFERVALPSLEEGQRTGALRFGDPRTMALVGALCITINAVAGFTNRSLRAQVAGLLATNYTSSQMTYDLRRLRRKGLIQRVPRSNTYSLTYNGVQVAIFYTKVYGRLLRPLLAVDHPPAVPELRRALRIIDSHVVDSIKRARLPTAA